MAKYFGRDGRPCQRVEWARLREDRSYAVVREYDNGEVYLAVEWLGEVSDMELSGFRDYWKMFKFHVCNYDATGKRKPDPVENGKTFAYEGEAIKAYEAFLERWTACHRNEDGVFEEDGNELTPPPPPDPDAPTTDATEVASVKLGEDDVGVW